MTDSLHHPLRGTSIGSSPPPLVGSVTDCPARLSEQPGLQPWLSQFTEEDRATAALLLNSLIVIDHVAFTDGIRRLVLALVQKKQGGVALFAARESPRRPSSRPYFRDRSTRPLSVSAGYGLGSEGAMANVCRDLARVAPDRLLDHPSLGEMAGRKCRHIVVLDDVIGSGGRITKFVRWLYECRTIKSWVSLGLVRFVVVAYACSEVGKKMVVGQQLVSADELWTMQTLSSGREAWSTREREAVIDVCSRYAARTGRPTWALGYRAAFTCVLLPHKCPNTNPAILWADNGTAWLGAFSERPEWIVTITQDDTTRRSKEDDLLRSLGVTQLADSLVNVSLSRQSRLSLLLLACVAKRRRRAEILSEMLETPLPNVRELVARGQSFGWLDDDARITPLGLRALADARRLGRVPSTGTQDNDGFYYPKSFRSPARSV